MTFSNSVEVTTYEYQIWHPFVDNVYQGKKKGSGRIHFLGMNPDIYICYIVDGHPQWSNRHNDPINKEDLPAQIRVQALIFNI
jgi:hypothetical protein